MLLRDHARQLRAHVNGLADKAYWEQFPHSPDLVVLFLPGAPFLAAAYEHDPDLFEHAHSRRVLLATPFILPFRWSRLFWTYIVPALPLVLTFDVVVSLLRL